MPRGLASRPISFEVQEMKKETVSIGGNISGKGYMLLVCGRNFLVDGSGKGVYLLLTLAK